MPLSIPAAVRDALTPLGGKIVAGPSGDLMLFLLCDSFAEVGLSAGAPSVFVHDLELLRTMLPRVEGASERMKKLTQERSIDTWTLAEATLLLAGLWTWMTDGQALASLEGEVFARRHCHHDPWELFFHPFHVKEDSLSRAWFTIESFFLLYRNRASELDRLIDALRAWDAASTRVVTN